MKEYIKPEAEIIEYSFEDIIAGASLEGAPETPIPDSEYDYVDGGAGEGSGEDPTDAWVSGNDDSFNDFFT